MAKKQTIIKKPVGNGNISITIENNLKNTNIAPPVVKKKRRKRNKVPTEEANLPPPIPLPPLKDVSYIKPPSDRFTVWRDNLDDSFNTTIPLGQAQQMGLLRSLATPALTNQPPPQPTVSTEQISTQTRPEQQSFQTQTEPEQQSIETQTEPMIFRSPAAIYNPLDISDDESTSSYVTAQRAPSISSSLTTSTSSLSAPLLLLSQLRDLLTRNEIGIGRGNAYDDNLQSDLYPNESIQDRFSDRSSLASFNTTQEEPNESIQDRFSDRSSLASFYTADQNRSPTPSLPARERSLTPPLPGREQAEKPFAVDIFEELAEERPGISIDEAGAMLAADKDATSQDVQEFKTRKQSIKTTARGQGKKHGKAGKDIQGRYMGMQEYVDSYLVGRGEYDARNFLTMDPEFLSIDPENLYRNSFTKIKNLVNMGTEKRQTRAKTRAKTRNEDIEAGS